MTLIVKRVPVEEIVALRRAVLRPGYPPEASTYAEDGDAVHVGAFDDGHLVGCATVFPDPWSGPEPPAEPAAWRLRGMAVDPQWRGTGVGAATLATAVSFAVHAGAPLMWANGRSSALGFYRRMGWRAVGDEFAAPVTGIPHYRIVLALSAQ
jgi:GNAT superfamily N-acetyltransferase